MRWISRIFSRLLFRPSTAMPSRGCLTYNCATAITRSVNTSDRLASTDWNWGRKGRFLKIRGLLIWSTIATLRWAFLTHWGSISGRGPDQPRRITRTSRLRSTYRPRTPDDLLSLELAGTVALICWVAKKTLKQKIQTYMVLKTKIPT